MDPLRVALDAARAEKAKLSKARELELEERVIAFKKEVGTCPSLSEIIPTLEKDVLNNNGHLYGELLSNRYIAGTLYEAWQLTVSVRETGDMFPIIVASWVRSETKRISRELVAKWNELHPEFPCKLDEAGYLDITESFKRARTSE